MKNTNAILSVLAVTAITGFYLLSNSQNAELSPINQDATSTENTLASSLNQPSKLIQANANIEPSAEKLKKKALKVTSKEATPIELAAKRKTLKQRLYDLQHCNKTDTCPVDNSDPRASDLLLGQQITDKLTQYTELHLENDYFDEEAAEMARDFINNPDGFVQEAALDLMSAMPPSPENAQALLDMLSDSYDAKIMNQAMKELERYPEYTQQIDQLFAQSLQTGSFYVAQEIALNILPYLNDSNLQTYIDIANKLPQNSKRADALWSNIKEYQLRQTGG
jgi:hypothetical protein